MATQTLPRQEVHVPRKPRRRSSGIWLTVLTWVATIIFVFPLIWMVITAFKYEQAAYTDPPTIFFGPTLEQFIDVFQRSFLPYFANSALVATVSTLVVLLLGIPAAYALSLVPVKQTPNVLGFFLGTKMLPIVAVIIPLYIISQNLGMLDNVWTLIVLYTAMNLPLAIWMMRSFFLEVPTEMIEAGRVDGADLPTLLRKVILPVVAPGIAATALIAFIFAWNEFFFAVNLTAVRAGTVPVFLVGFITSEGLYWAQLSAAALLASIPVMIIGWIAQKHLVRGLSMGAVK